MGRVGVVQDGMGPKGVLSVDRREFMKRAGGALAGMGAAAYVPSRVLGAAPSNRITLGVIGMGNQGFNDTRGFLQLDDVQVVAVCDVNRDFTGYRDRQQRRGREPGRELVDKHYASKQSSGTYQGTAAYADFREMLEREDIDAVLIVTPDHWHGVMTVMAADAGKHIYCEKPLSLTVADGRAMVEAVRRNGVVMQTGSHERSNGRARFVCELARNGYLGEVKRVRTDVGTMNAYLEKSAPKGAWQPSPLPAGFDYDGWLGPAPWEPYHRDRCFYSFRFILEYSGGQTTNYGAHSNDLAQWGLGMDDSGPVVVEDRGGQFPRDGLFDAPSHIHFGAWYANGVELVCKTSRRRGVGVRFEGTEGSAYWGYGMFGAQPRSLLNVKLRSSDVHLYRSGNHYRNFIDCIKTGREVAAPAEVGHRSATVCHLGNIAMQLQRRLEWDPVAERFVGDEQANRLLARPKRAPWRV